MEKKKLGLQLRSLTIKADAIAEDDRTLEMSFSSEEPYERFWGIEVLSHKAKHVLMDFMASGNAPLLVGHNHDDQIGVIEKAWLQDGVGRARVRFGQSNRAEEIFKDVVDGIRRNVSVGYHVHSMTLLKKSDDGPHTYLVDSWSPKEASIVSVPADESVGFRAGDDEIETIIKGAEQPKVEKMTEKKAESKVEPAAPKVDVTAERAKERFRVREIEAMGKRFNMDEKVIDAAINDEETVDSFRAKVMDKVIEDNAQQPAVDVNSFSDQDKRDMANYSFVKALREASEHKLTGLEAEMHQDGVAQLKSLGIAAQGSLSIPYQVLAQRDLTVGTDSQGGYTVATEFLGGSFIELLQNRMKVKAMGATVLDNLVGPIAIPSQATGATAAWEGENDANAESSPTFGQVALAPNRVGTFSEVSKQLLVQSSLSVENIVRNLIADSIALAIDLAALHGPGTGDAPLGIAGTSGIGSVAGGTNGLAPSWAHIVELETDVAAANADVNKMGYLTNAKVRGKLKTVEKASGTAQFVWSGNALNGYRAEVSNQVSSALTKGSSSGVCSAIFFGNWADLLLAFWGGLDVVVDPYTLATTNLTRITANTYADVAVRHAASFSAMLDALTT